MRRDGLHDLLTDLTAGDLDAARVLVDVPVPDLAARVLAGDVVALGELIDDPLLVEQAFACAWAPALASPLAAALMPGRTPDAHEPGRLARLVTLMPAPPLDPRELLVRLLRLLTAAPQAVDAAAAHLEQLYSSLPDDIDPAVASGLGLPRAVGAVLDLRVLAYENGAQLSTVSASPVLPLLTVLHSAGVQTTWDLLDHPLPGPVPATVLGDVASALMMLGAYAAAVRTATVSLLADPSSLPAHRVVSALVGDERARVPEVHIEALLRLAI